MMFLKRRHLVNPSVISRDSETIFQNIKPHPIYEKDIQIKRTIFENKKPIKKKLELVRSGQEGLYYGIQANGVKYSVRENRDRFFFPDEWMNFFDKLKPNQKMTFEVLINTGARYNEAYNIKVGDCDLQRGNIILRVTKTKAREGERNPRPRTISISSQFNKKLIAYIKQNKLRNENYLNLLTRPGAHLALKNTLQRIGVKDWYMFGLHNIRKTHGNYLKALGTDSGEICIRLGHDYNTFLKHYASPNIFNFEDMQNIRLILGDLYRK